MKERNSEMSKSASMDVKRRGRVRKFSRNFLHHWPLWVMMLPAILYILLFVYKPMYGIVIAFKQFSFRKGIMGSDWIGLANFSRLIASYWFPVIVRNTLTLSILSLIVSFPMPIILALSANEIGNEHVKKIFQTVSYAPHFISTVVMCGIIILFLSPSNGIINHIIRFFGGEEYFFMQEEAAFKWVYVLSGVWQNTGWSAIIYYAALSGVDQSLLEAAEIDGASRLKRIIYINFPVLVPTISVLFILNCGSLLSIGYEKVFLLQNQTNISSSEVISTYVYKVGLINADYGFSTAASLLNSVVNSIVLIGANTLSREVTSNSLW